MELIPILTLSYSVTPSQHDVGWGFVITILRNDYSLALTVWNVVCAIADLRNEFTLLPMVLLHNLGDLRFVS